MKTRRAARTPEIFQMESVECGAAALGMILGYHGRFVPLPELRRACGVSREGSRASHLLQAARSHGLQASGIRCTMEALEQVPLPAILFWEFNHFVVLEGWDQRSFFINDPACGHRRVSVEEFSRAFTGVALRMKPGENFQPCPRPSRFWESMNGWLRRDCEVWALVGLCAALLAVPSVAIAGMIRMFVDEFLVGGASRWVLPIVSGLVGCLLVQWVLIHAQSRVLLRWQTRQASMESSKWIERLLRAPMDWYADRNRDDIADRSLIPSQAARRFSMHVIPAFANLVPAVACLGLMAVWDARLAGVMVLLFVAACGFGVFQETGRADEERQLTHLRGRRNAIALYGLSVIEHLKCGSGAAFLNRLREFQIRIRNLYQSIEVRREITHWGILFPAACGLIVLIAWGAIQILNQEITIGVMAGIFVLWLQLLVFLNPLMALPVCLAQWQRDLTRLDDVPNVASCTTAPITKFEQLEVRAVSFGYTRFSEPVIRDVSFQLMPGQIMALTGPSGCGKSTLVQLIQGAIPADSGVVRLNGQPVTPSLIASCAGVVDQEIHFFQEKVYDHLRLGNPDAEWDGPIDAAGLSAVMAARGDVELLDNGNTFSGGQRQRLEIARILARNAGFYILDEALSGLDADGAESIVNTFRARGCAVFLVTHRPEILRLADEILLMNEGRVVDRGNYEHLSITSNFFRGLMGGCA